MLADGQIYSFLYPVTYPFVWRHMGFDTDIKVLPTFPSTKRAPQTGTDQSLKTRLLIYCSYFITTN